MAYNDISKNFTYENGGTIDGDLALTTMAANTKIKNTASGQLYAKRSGFSNVFDKTNTYANYLKADEFGIITSGSGNGVASITYSTSGRKITQNLTTFTTPSDLATVNDNLKSQAVGSITVSGRTVTYKNVNGQPLGSFQTQDNNTTYSAGSGLSLNGTTFSLALTGWHIANALGYTPARPNTTGLIDSYSGGGWINGPANYLKFGFGDEVWLLQWFVRSGSGGGYWPAGSYSRTPLAMVTPSWPGGGHYAVDHSDNLSFDNTTYSFEKYEGGGNVTILAFGRTN